MLFSFASRFRECKQNFSVFDGNAVRSVSKVLDKVFASKSAVGSEIGTLTHPNESLLCRYLTMNQEKNPP